jgi:hypothetical protein
MDVTTADAGHDADAGAPGDAAREADARPDTGGPSDGGTFDVIDAGPDGPNAVQQFAMQYASAYCQAYLHCCNGYDAGRVNLAGCAAASYGGASQETTLPNANGGVYTNGHLSINGTAAANCLTTLPNLACSIAAADNAAATNACFGVFVGDIPTGTAGCLSSFECVNGYCALAGDGGKGTCTALVAAGGPCSGTNGQEQCSQANLKPTAYCTSVDLTDGGTVGVCAPLLADNAPCMTDMSCQAEFCFAAGGTQCGGSGVLNTSAGYCTTYGDAGP